jgi:carboxyl-terminal processing protease
MPTMPFDQKQRSEILSAIKKRILKQHVGAASVNYEHWSRLFDRRVPELLSADTDEFETGVQRLLAELRSSHTVFYHERTIQVLPQHSINATFRSFKLRDGEENWFFLDVFEDGPAHVAGIRPGDLLVAVDGTPFVPPSMPRFRIGYTHRLSISNIQGENRRDIAVGVPLRKGTKARPPIVAPKSLVHAMIAPNVGLLRVLYFPGAFGMQFAKALDAAVADLKVQGCDRLIIDLRGNIGGSLGLARLASYLCPGELPIGHSLTPQRQRAGYDPKTLPRVPMPQTKRELSFTLARFAFRDKSVFLLTQGLGAQPFHGKIAVLVNEWTNSAAEMVASFAAENNLATIVGTKTAGSVLGAANFAVGSGYWLRLPVFGWYTLRGNCLEGNGVSPEVPVDVDPQVLNTGVDQQMEKGIEIVNCMTSGTAPP